MFKKLIEKASSSVAEIGALVDKNTEDAKKNVEEKMRDIGSIKNSVAEMASSGADHAFSIFEKNWPLIERILLDGLLSIAIEHLKDDELVRGIMEKVYETLPIGVRLVLPRDRYIEFAIRQREPLLLQLDSYREKRALAGEDIGFSSPQVDSASKEADPVFSDLEVERERG